MLKETLRKWEKGMAIILVLLCAVVLFILVTSMVYLNTHNMRLMNGYRDRVAALEMARAGVARSIYLLTCNSTFSQDVNSQDHLQAPGSYTVTFNSGKPFYSVNNIWGYAASTTPNFRGQEVMANTADIVVTAKVNSATKRIRVVLKRGIDTNHALLSLGKIDLEGDCKIDGIKSLKDKSPVPGMVHSNYASQTGLDYSINWNNSGTFYLNPEGKISCVSGANEEPIANSIKENVETGQIDESAPNISLPEVDIQAAIEGATGYPMPRIDTSGSGIYYTNGQVQISQNNYVNGNYEVNGDLNLNGGTLFVNGNLTVNGSIRGKGAIYVKGDTTARGDTSIVTNQSNGATIFGQGDVTLTGIDATGYLDTLAGEYPDTVGTALTNYKTTMSSLQAELNSDSPDIHRVWSLCGSLSQHLSASSREGLIECAIPAPDGSIPLCNINSRIPALVIAIENSLGPAYQYDLKAQQTVKALHGLMYYYRSGLHWETGLWDDDILAEDERSVDRQFRMVTGGDYGAGIAASLTQEMFFDGIRTFVENNPMDLSWAGESYFQGFIYSKGKLKVSNKLNVIGVVMVKGDVNLTGGSTLTFDEEYCNIISGAPLTLRILTYEEI